MGPRYVAVFLVLIAFGVGLIEAAQSKAIEDAWVNRERWIRTLADIHPGCPVGASWSYTPDTQDRQACLYDAQAFAMSGTAYNVEMSYHCGIRPILSANGRVYHVKPYPARLASGDFEHLLNAEGHGTFAQMTVAGPDHLSVKLPSGTVLTYSDLPADSFQPYPCY